MNKPVLELLERVVDELCDTLAYIEEDIDKRQERLFRVDLSFEVLRGTLMGLSAMSLSTADRYGDQQATEEHRILKLLLETCRDIATNAEMCPTQRLEDALVEVQSCINAGHLSHDECERLHAAHETLQ